MSTSHENPLLGRFLDTAETVAQTRPDADPAMAREAMAEAATLLHNGLALDGLDQHDADAVIERLRVDLVAEDPGAAVRARSEAALEDPGDLHDPEAVSAAYLVSAAILQL
ncbi:hypothetical protein EXE58_12330 [Nocardioides seonyuensis]|uniref:Uncharacterized protein n=1 Tax=Nocardioides seonyuensis TaxID=2518371 RepID=A0A4P7IFZ4_9ACTN|nr:hypothetical protein [Nocardioides seonyuensis]QBX56176.1 hypothetical protein EXE58_12330 [Nocardioides seonyuensis]